MRTLAAVIVVLAAAPLAAQPYPGGSVATGADAAFPDSPYYVASPDQLIRQGVDRLAGFLMGSGETDRERVRQFVEAEIAPLFDFSYMARWAAGPLLHRLDPAQQAALAARLRGLFLEALTRHLGTFEPPLPRVEVYPARPGRSFSEAVVFARVFAGGRPPARLEFRFYWSGQGWKVYDAVANGASAVSFYRSYFTRLLRTLGPDALLR